MEAEGCGEVGAADAGGRQDVEMRRVRGGSRGARVERGGIGGRGGRLDDGQQAGRVAGDRLPHRPDVPDEHAGVPAEVAGGEVARGRLGVGLLDEAAGAAELRVRAEVDDVAALDVAEARGGVVGDDADGDDGARGGGGREAVREDEAEGRGVRHDLGGRQKGGHALRVARGDEAAGKGAGGGRVAAAGFADDVLRGQVVAGLARGVGQGG